MSGDDERPLILERFRRAGLIIAIVLAPLLVVTLAQTAVSRTAALAILAAGAVAVVIARRGG